MFPKKISQNKQTNKQTNIGIDNQNDDDKHFNNRLPKEIKKFEQIYETF